MNEQAKYMSEARGVRERLGAKNVFLFIFEPQGQEGKVVCGGDLDIETAVKLLEALSALQVKIVADLKQRAAHITSDKNHLSN